MLSFLLKQNWIGIEYFLLNFFATFASVLQLQITVTFDSVFTKRPSQKERAVHCKNEAMFLEPFSWRCIESVVCVCSIHETD